MIRGFLRGETPLIVGRLSLPRLAQASAAVEFIVDTGAEATTLNPIVLAALGLDAQRDLTQHQIEVNVGVGGAVEVRRVRALLEFTSDDGEAVALTVFVRIPVTAPTDVPSVLGMDAISVFRLTVSVREGRMELEPLLSRPT